jgi:hypothetical protein
VILIGVGIAAWLLGRLAGNLAADKPVDVGPAMTQPRPAATGQATAGSDPLPASTCSVLTGDMKLVGSLPEQVPERGGWTSVNKDAGTAIYTHMGVSATYNWTVPQAIPTNGTPVTISGHAKAVEGNRMNANIALSGTNLTLVPEEAIVNRTAEGATTAGEDKEITVTPSPGASSATLSVYVGFTYRFDYLYERAQ